MRKSPKVTSNLSGGLKLLSCDRSFHQFHPQIFELLATMRPFLSRLSSELSRLWLLCGASLFANDSFACAQLPVWSNEVGELSARLSLLGEKSSSPAVLDDVNDRSKDQSIASSQTIRELQTNLPNLPCERTGHPRLHPQCDKPLVVPPMHGIYDWSHHFELPQQGQGVVFFTACCSNDVHVAISPQPQSMNPMYEFVIGGWSNTASVLRHRSQGSNLCTVPVGLNKPRLDTLNDLWISIDKTARLLRIGQGREPSLESTFLIYKDPRFLSDARYVCFTSFDVPVTYSNIMALALE